jgi:hypothetical protein
MLIDAYVRKFFEERGTSNMDTDYTMLLRSITLLVACLGGIFSIFLGWRLYCKGVESAVHSDFSNESKFRIKFSAVGPGVFFALFGMLIIYKVVTMQAEVTEEIPVEASQTSMLAPRLQFIQSAVAATTTAAPSRKCLMMKRVRKQYDGSEINADLVNEALDASILALQKFAPQAQDQPKLVRNLQVLQEMRVSTGDWTVR